MKSPSRRALLTRLPAFTAVAAVTGDGSAPARRASIGDYAALTFADEGPAARDAVGPLSEWLKRAPMDHFMCQVAAAAMRTDDRRMHADVRDAGAPEIMECVEALRILQGRYEGLADVLEAAVTRMMAGLSRHVLLTEGHG